MTIPGERGLRANSDGDVVLHALCNAISQAVGGRSIGVYADPLCLEKGIKDSAEYLKVILKMMAEKGYCVNNIGIMIECARPKIEPYAEVMKKRIASLLGVVEEAVGITATSGERLTSFGKGEGIQVFAVASLTGTD